MEAYTYNNIQREKNCTGCNGEGVLKRIYVGSMPNPDAAVGDPAGASSLGAESPPEDGDEDDEPPPILL